MNWKKIQTSKWYKVFINTYVVVSLFFIVWMFFFDSTSYLRHDELQKEVDRLESVMTFLKTEIEKDSAQMKYLANPENLERYARENFYLKKPEEEVLSLNTRIV